MLKDMDVAVIGAGGLFRAGLVSLLSPVARNVIEAPDVNSLRDTEAIGLVLAEVTALGGHPAAAITRLREIQPQCHIAVLSDTLDSTRLAACFAGGADGFLLKDISADNLIESLRLLVLGEKVFPSSLAGLIGGEILPAPEPSPSELSQRELDILYCLVDGDSNKHIANRLHITEATVKVHLKSILRKTRAMNRTQAAIWALQRGMRKVKSLVPADDEPEIFKSEAPARF